ncbi:hypothetical protein [Amycolatopsis sp. cg13]|uniref:hypothetical protein n=1 Tax=Amycolatopsis sp. cg13 TaxID=3238807 RepID=UPI003524A71C
MTHPDIVTYEALPAASGRAHALRTRKPSAAPSEPSARTGNGASGKDRWAATATGIAR